MSEISKIKYDLISEGVDPLSISFMEYAEVTECWHVIQNKQVKKDGRSIPTY